MPKMLCNFIEVALQHGCSPVNLLHIFRIPFSRTPLKAAPESFKADNCLFRGNTYNVGKHRYCKYWGYLSK